MDPLTRHRTLQLLGVELRARPRDGDGDGFYDPDGKGPAKDRTPLPPKPQRMSPFARAFLNQPAQPKRRLRTPEAAPVVAADAPQTMAEHVGHWHADLTGMRDLVDAAASGATPVRLVRSDEHSKAALVNFGDGGEGVATRYLGTPDRIAEDQADSDQLVSALARAVGIAAPRILRVDEDRTVADVVDGQPFTDDTDTDDGMRLGVLDLLAGVDDRDPDSVIDGPDGVVPVRSDNGFTAVDEQPPDAQTRRDRRSEQLQRVADAIDAFGPRGASRADINARTRLPAALRDELLAELLAVGDFSLMRSNAGSTGHGARFVRVRTRPDVAAEPTLSPRWLAAATPPQNEPTLAFWLAFVADGEWADNPLTRADITWLRRRLDEIRPQFEHLGRDHWWQFASDRLEVLAQHATGTVDLFA